MSKPFSKAAFLFRRDLRLEDNTGLLATLEQSESVLPVFIFDPTQVNEPRHDYFSEPAFQFLLNSLHDLNEALQARGSKLYVFYGDPKDIVSSLITSDNIDLVAMNKDYTPFARKRDKAIANICKKHTAAFERYDDLTLSSIESIRTGQDKLYTVFTPFMRNAATNEVAEPRKNKFDNYFSSALKTEQVKLTKFTAAIGTRELVLDGGRDEALTMMRDPAFLKNYKDNRNRTDMPDGTSQLSAHHKFGTISIRESYHMAAEHAGKGSHFISELYWRDFYYYTAYHFPVVFKQSFLPWAKNIKWVNDKKQFIAWCKGKTGVPMVDAGMRQLNHSGYMHNRTRMVVASYLTKNLLIDWRWGEQYFATQLIDYDPAQNNGGWQWSASVGTDPRPLRIFNPYTQAEKFDPNAAYIKKWIPELAQVPNETLSDGKTQDFGLLAPDYPSPLIDQRETFHRAMATYKQAKETWKANKASEEN